ncbi:peptidase U32 family protein [Alkalihalophilus marmarensis]|uniref:peptidase U32 family protein n=1 Tax=Alkalihalophilus marmarensis TaxID=521377 RepID=UPI002DBA2B2B|nr:U32 family peptidase [Alkalihalophilus marmarensis]MEC2074433.1 U32 family peptidase [Alkalihalophilus marmarensis]
MNSLKLIAPVRSSFMMKQMLEAKVDEVHLGLKPTHLINLSFDSRYQFVNGIPTQVENLDELSEITKIGHENNVIVNFMANSKYVPESLREDYLSHIRWAVEAGVNRITVSNLSALNWLAKADLGIPIDVGTFMAATNIGYFRYLESVGVQRVGVPQGMTLDEISDISAKTNLKLIVTGNFGGGNVCGHCRLEECPTNSEIGQGCRTSYKVTDLFSGVDLENGQVLDGATDCSLCSIPELIDAGVGYIKLIGREVPNPITTSKICQIYKTWITEVEKGRTSEEIYSALDDEDLMWNMMWKPRFCEKKRCSYLKTPVTNSYV